MYISCTQDIGRFLGNSFFPENFLHHVSIDFQAGTGSFESLLTWLQKISNEMVYLCLHEDLRISSGPTSQKGCEASPPLVILGHDCFDSGGRSPAMP